MSESFDATVLLRTEQTAGAVSAIALTIPAGWAGPPLHHHAFDEAFYVLEGELTFTVEDDEVVAGPGTFVLVPPGVHHTFANRGDAVVRMVNIHAPAGFDLRLESD
jgi:mannose-6-phosphate isomerase-like protein (cupin superfamily)